jgi:hypothetical protein
MVSRLYFIPLQTIVQVCFWDSQILKKLLDNVFHQNEEEAKKKQKSEK